MLNHASGFTYQINNLLTEVSSWIDRIASANSFATLKHLIFGERQAFSVGMVLVTTTSLSGEASIRSTAGPLNTAWVADARTVSAPLALSASAALTRVPAVSIISSM